MFSLRGPAEAALGQIGRKYVHFPGGIPVGMERSNHPFHINGRELEFFQSRRNIIFRSEPALLRDSGWSLVLLKWFGRNLNQALAIAVAVSTEAKERSLGFV